MGRTHLPDTATCVSNDLYRQPVSEIISIGCTVMHTSNLNRLPPSPKHIPSPGSLLGLGKSQHGEMIKKMREEYHNCENDSLTGLSSRSTTMSSSARHAPLPRKEKTLSSLGMYFFLIKRQSGKKNGGTFGKRL
jgi:hypothetical protein